MDPLKKAANAQKWTREIVSEYLDMIEGETAKPDAWFLGTALRKARLGKHVWRYWKRIFEDDDILERMELIESMYESKVFEAAAHRKIPASMGIWILKYVHHWGSKNEDDYA
jgi:hypothetical protein